MQFIRNLPVPVLLTIVSLRDKLYGSYKTLRLKIVSEMAPGS